MLSNVLSAITVMAYQHFSREEISMYIHQHTKLNKFKTVCTKE